MHDSFHLFVYGTLRSGEPAAQLLKGCTRIGTATVSGVLYDIDGDFPALLPYGPARIAGEVWRCPADRLATLDAYEGVQQRLFRRIGVHAQMDDDQEEIACWVYVAGPALSRKLIPAARIR